MDTNEHNLDFEPVEQEAVLGLYWPVARAFAAGVETDDTEWMIPLMRLRLVNRLPM